MSEEEPLFTEIARVVANAQADELAVKQRLMIPRDLFVEQKMESIVEALKEENKKILDSLAKANELLMEDLNLLSNEEREHHVQELEAAIDKISGKIDQEVLAQADSLQKILGLSNETVLWIYKLGYKYFEMGKYEESYSLFLVLTLLDPLVGDYWSALGFAQRGLLLDANALKSFSLASNLSPANPTIRYQLAEIYLKLKQPVEAMTEAGILMEIIKKQNLDGLKPHAELLLSAVQKEQLT